VGIYREEARRERGGRREDGAEKRVIYHLMGHSDTALTTILLIDSIQLKLVILLLYKYSINRFNRK